MSTKFNCFTFPYPKDLNYFYEFKGKMCKNLTDLEEKKKCSQKYNFITLYFGS